ncbi:hypothetical protein IQ273_12925 [Nodosilinea sp. LEGE 07298]|uniref:hypothetical protein n=1 Tax=Nodosilinea sp. LEGE 07298 TaxID=2777970 RepID=UPI00188227AA|nr:hypothetical protein [Nodosilinea sp. LEGE 07298]MBE9110316.1 hypothetical protein [Nodosilinea sp. LEGE 07298]
MPKLIDLTDEVFGRLTVQSKTANKGKDVCWKCICECGKESTVSTSALRSGNTKSCGCGKSSGATVHGMYTSPEYNSWEKMKSRCLNPNNEFYPHYGGRGITVCDRWLNSFENFYEDMGPRPKGTSIDRKENDGNYEPGNCRWATKKVQANNTSRNVFLEYKNISKTVTQWSGETGISAAVIKHRMKQGWPAEKILNTPARPKKTA